MNTDTRKCRYKFCLHSTRDVPVSEAVKEKTSYYHTDCYQTKEDIKEIIRLFTEYIDPHPIYAQLQKVIQTIIFQHKVPSDYLLFGMQYYIEHRIPLNHPQGLYYVVKSGEVKKAYNLQSKKKADRVAEISTGNEEVVFEHKPVKAKTIENMMEG